MTPNKDIEEQARAEFAAKLWTFFDLYVGDGSGEHRHTPQYKQFLKQIMADFDHALDQQRQEILDELREMIEDER